MGEWDWENDGKTALQYHSKIAIEGWPRYSGVVFKEINKQKTIKLS
jgi:hypothetical protein